MNGNETMRKLALTILSIGLIFFIAGCQWIDVRLSTPTVAPAETINSPISGETLDPSTVRTLQLFPLREGSTWIYEYLGYDQRGEVLWKVVETVVEARIVDGYYIVEIMRTKEHLDGDLPDDFLNTPDTGSVWYLVDGDHVYQLASPWEPDLTTAKLDLILPFPEDGEGWYPNPEQRDLTEPGELGFRHASAPYPQTLPTGGLYTCYNVGTQIEDGVQEGTFCETMGFVFKELKYFHRSFGYRVELIGFSFP